MNKLLNPAFQNIDTIVRVNMKRVLSAFQENQIGARHFAGVSGYGHDDLGRQALDRVFAKVMGAEAAAVRVQFVSGTHAIACALFGVLRPGDELLAVAGAPYDTLEEVIGLRGTGQGSLKDFGVVYRQLELIDGGKVNWPALAQAVGPNTRMVHIQRSCGYDWRPSLTIDDIERVVKSVKQQNPDVVCFVDNCYGEFVETREPCHVGADLIAGSSIKNPGGTIAPAGGVYCRTKAVGGTSGLPFDGPGDRVRGGSYF